MSEKYDYDAIIIGAGIGGLVCGCYLAKAGFKTLIVEKNAKPGGYCTSFTKKGFKFDACAHSLGSLREGGILKTILKELKLLERTKITRSNPQDIIVTPEGRISFWNDINKTIVDFQKFFPKDASSIKKFFNFLLNCDGLKLNLLKNMTFHELLKQYFNNDKLKSVLSLPVLGNTGMSANVSSALTAVALYKEFMLDGGYYPNDAMQKLPDIILERFKEYGGDILLSRFVNKITVRKNSIRGVEINKNRSFTAKYVISDIDATCTFFDLVGKKNISLTAQKKLKALKPSLSILILYLGLANYKPTDLPMNTNVWFLPDYNTETNYNLARNGSVDSLNWFLLRFSADFKSIIMLVNSPFKNKNYWEKNKCRLIDLFIKKIETIAPDISQHIMFKDAATPNTLYKWTSNYKGAAYGWEGNPKQFAIRELSQVTKIRNLYLTGHWATLGQGISGVARLGKDTAKIILNKENITS